MCGTFNKRQRIQTRCQKDPQSQLQAVVASSVHTHTLTTLFFCLFLVSLCCLVQQLSFRRRPLRFAVIPTAKLHAWQTQLCSVRGQFTGEFESQAQAAAIRSHFVVRQSRPSPASSTHFPFASRALKLRETSLRICGACTGIDGRHAGQQFTRSRARRRVSDFDAM